MVPNKISDCPVSGERFTVLYALTGPEAEARAKAGAVRIEQTVEFPEQYVPAGLIRDHVLGRLESFAPQAGGKFLAKISYAVEIVGCELTQLLNVLFGITGLKPGIRLEGVELPGSMYGHFKGPRFGRRGLRDHLGVWERPILCAILKPLGLSSQGLAELAYQFTLGGIDLIKDDHGLADQPFAPYMERVALCAEAVRRANGETGGRSVYMPHVTGSPGETLNRARFAKRHGAGALMVLPGLTGFEAIRTLADDPDLNLPLFLHPALLGPYILHPDHGFSHAFLFGQLPRLAGGDAVIFPHYGGRFAFTEENCREIVRATEANMGPIKPIFPSPGGGLRLDQVPELTGFYGPDVVLLIGGDLFFRSPDLIENCLYLREKIKKIV